MTARPRPCAQRPSGRRGRSRRLLAAALTALVLLAGLPVGGAVGSHLGLVGNASAATPAFHVYGSVEQVAVVGVPGATVALETTGGDPVAAGVLDGLGGWLEREVPPGGYRVTYQAPAEAPVVTDITVQGPGDHPDAAWYAARTVEAGYGYLETRDGTVLSYNALLPPGPGPHPTLVEYSGYDPSNPANVPPTGLLAGFLGYAYVAVNMRGTGCSGGSFDYFETLQSLDGYDVVETVAAQPWAAKVGMVGISYPGISQLFVAQTQPPSLAAITPVSVISDTYRSTLYPGGIFNDGFALSWAQGRQADARYPGGQAWAQQRINAGDQVCAGNQRLRGHNPDILDLIEQNQFYAPEGDALAPYSFVDRIQAPTLVVGAWQDEQTGGHFPEMLDRFAPGTYVRSVMTNGTHVEPFGPDNLMAMLEFLDFFVKEEVPEVPAAVRALAPVLYAQLMGAASPPDAIPPDRFTGMSYEAALAAYLAEDPVTVWFENGMGPDGTDAGFPRGTFSLTGSTWPLEGTQPWTLHLGPDRALSADPPEAGVEPAHYLSDPTNRPRTNYRRSVGGCGSDSMWAPRPVGADGESCYLWTHPEPGEAAQFLTQPVTEPVVLAGTASADLWVGADVADVDLEVVLSEVRPDGEEMYLQTGYLRVGHRALDEPASTPLAPRHLHTQAAYQPIPAGELVEARVLVHPFAHVLRPGSRLKLSIEPPGGNRPLWTFDAQPAGAVPEVQVGRSAAHPSRLVLPVVQGAAVPAGVLGRWPICEDVRSQPCRASGEAPVVVDPPVEPPDDEEDPPVPPPPPEELPDDEDPPAGQPPAGQPPAGDPSPGDPPAGEESASVAPREVVRAAAGGGGGSGGRLPRTGVELVVLALAAVGVALAGASLVAGSRRRARST